MGTRACDYLRCLIKLIVEVVSTNWETDYARKVEEYALLGIPEYWIVDYRGLGRSFYWQTKAANLYCLSVTR
jgi:Uma2 family endonuclease